MIQNKDFPADLIVLGIHDFDIVLVWTGYPSIEPP